MYFYVADQQVDVMPRGFYKLIYSVFDPKTMTSIDFEDLEHFLINTYNMTGPMSEKIITDNDTELNGKLNKNQYKDIMKQLYKVKPLVLSKRIEAFDKCDYNYNGYISKIELPCLHRQVEIKLKRTGSYVHLQPVEYILYDFDINEDGQLNFLEVNKFMAELSTDFYP